MQVKQPSLYEINTRILLKTLGPGCQLSDIPSTYWKDLQDKGMHWVWLMGIWEIREKALDKNLIPEHMMKEFKTLIPDITDKDISGSPYAIHQYIVDPSIGDAEQLHALRKKLNKLGIKLMLDFVPNHFGAHSRWIEEHPEYFIEVDEATYLKDRTTFYRPWHDKNRFFAHGKDPYFDAWQDTVQVNYANPATHAWLQDILHRIGGMCDGIRCDMAMLPVQRIFSQTWDKVVAVKEDKEFWRNVIAAVKEDYPDFVFLAECYWDMEAELMQLGFDYCYDKVFYDRLSKSGDEMRRHFNAEPWWLLRTARFLENHDEKRVASRLPLAKQMAAAALVAFGPGIRFWHMGQWEGRGKHVPVQIARYPDEPIGVLAHQSYYQQLLELNQHELFQQGEWRNVEPASTSKDVICWLWKYKNASALVLINYSENEVEYALDDQLHALNLKDPVNMLNGERIEAKSVALVAWGVCVFRVTSK